MTRSGSVVFPQGLSEQRGNGMSQDTRVETDTDSSGKFTSRTRCLGRKSAVGMRQRNNKDGVVSWDLHGIPWLVTPPFGPPLLHQMSSGTGVLLYFSRPLGCWFALWPNAS